MSEPGEKTYIGDGVYAEFDKWGGLTLTTEDGVSVQNRVVLEPREWEALREWVDRFWFQVHERQREARERESSSDQKEG